MKSRSKKQSVVKLTDKTRELQKAYKALTRSPNGRLVLEDLQAKFYDVDLSSSDEHSSSVKVGRHLVVLYIKRMINAGEKL